MKTLHRVVGGIAAISVTIFIISLVVLATVDGNHNLAVVSCQISLMVSFIALVIFEPERLKKDQVAR